MCRLMFGNADHSEKLKDSAWTLLVQMSPTGPLPNRLTPLINLPEWMSPWKQFERRRYEKQSNWFFELQQEARDKMARGKDHPSWSRQFLEQKEKLGWDDREGAFTVGMMAVAAVFTIGSLLHTYFLAMVLHPEWQEKLHAEIDAATDGRMPNPGDTEKLPVLRAIVKECLRWRPIVPTGDSNSPAFRGEELITSKGLLMSLYKMTSTMECLSQRALSSFHLSGITNQWVWL